jgi:hypothetical protein
MTDPQNDIPCRDCKRPTQHATERCDDCRTPAGRLLTELRALLIKGKAIDGFEVKVGDLLVSADPASWAICHESESGDHDGNITSAANAIAAIVDHAGTIATLAAEVERLRVELEKPVASAWSRGLGGFIRWANNGRVSAAAGSESGWNAYHNREAVASGPETGDAGRHAADLAILAAGYRLVGGVHPLPDGVRS